MESLNPSRVPTSKEKLPSSSAPSPIKSLSTASIPSTGLLEDEILTPEKPIQLPRRTRNRKMAFSVKEVKRIAVQLQSSDQGSTDRAGAIDSTGDLVLLDEQIGACSGANAVRKSLKAKAPVKLPEKYEMLVELFNCMESSIRLLQLKGSRSTFSNICPKINCLTDRRFTYGHLAQLKYILPEAISIKKVLVHDETTCCMKPELQVILQSEALKDNLKQKGENGYSILRKVFRARLVDFSKEHPEGDDIPEETLPEPFNQAKPGVLSNMARTSTNSLSTDQSSNTLSQQHFAVPSHMPTSFRRRFSQKVPLPDEEKTILECLNKPSPDECPISIVSSPVRCISKPPISKKSLFGSSIPQSSLSTHGNLEEVNTVIKNEKFSPEEISNIEGTPAKLASTPARLMAITPEQQTPKRCRPTIDYDSTPSKQSMKRSTRTKLFRTPRKGIKAENEENETKSFSANDDAISFLPAALLQSVREKEKKALEDQESGVSEAKRRQQMIACLPKLFDMILLIFQSGKRSVITKQELVHKIVSSHCEIVDINEVEEQLKLLQELVPDWISGKKASSGDFLYCVNKMSSPELIRRRLAVAE